MIVGMRWGTLLLLWGALAGGCAAPAKPVKYAGDVGGQPSIETLPSLDVADSELTPEMRMARLLSAETLELPPPQRPTDRAGQALSAWSEGEFKRWLTHKQERADAARAELDRAALQNHRQRIMAGALVGLIYEDIARTLLTVPAPSELDSEPEISAAFQELLLKQAEPYLMQARLAYAACAGNAQGMSSLGHWVDFCSSRRHALPANEAPGDGVEVIV
ncbi:MAG TPA: hypothetical protein VFZ61_14875, partial [Polyangiales bacterium]